MTIFPGIWCDTPYSYTGAQGRRRGWTL